MARRLGGGVNDLGAFLPGPDGDWYLPGKYFGAELLWCLGFGRDRFTVDLLLRAHFVLWRGVYRRLFGEG